MTEGQYRLSYSKRCLHAPVDCQMSRRKEPNGLHWQTVSPSHQRVRKFKHSRCVLINGSFLAFIGHESSFMDVPRLSTIQALLLLLKARESLPKKGYYYRSWQTVKTIVSMAKDLDIHEHYGLHAEGKSCGLPPVECLVQTRVWQALLVVEVMIGAPQGMYWVFTSATLRSNRLLF